MRDSVQSRGGSSYEPDNSWNRLESQLESCYDGNRSAEHFLQAFEKPTQIYRYLGAHHRSPVSWIEVTSYSHISSQPIFLQRTLCYMRCRRGRPFRIACPMSLDSIADRLSNALSEKTLNELPELAINITSFTDPSMFASVRPTTISVEASVISVFEKVVASRRQKVTETKKEKKRTIVGIWEVPVNVEPKSKYSRTFAFHLDNSAFQCANAKFDHSTLVFMAHPKPCYPSPIKNIPSSSSDIEVPSKRRRKQGELVYRGEVIIYRKDEPCLLVPGDYEVRFVKRSHPNTFMSSEYGWESMDEGFEENLDNNLGVMEDLQPSLTIKVAWTAQDGGKEGKKGNRIPFKSQIPMIAAGVGPPPRDNACHKFSEDNIRIIYRFSYNIYEAQTTIGKSNFCCPWCSLNCMSFKPLKMHLIHCHSRFNFKMSTETNGTKYEAKVDVTPNEGFDGSYAGNPHHLVQPELGLFFARNGPTRRNSVTLILVSKKGQEFRNEEYDSENEEGEAFITQGHDRLYYHTKTCLPIRPQEMDYDSESENDPLWMRTKTQLMIDEFTDVNEGEKEVMKLWNLLIMKYGFNADIQIPEACRVFINDYHREIFKKNIRYNFILHLNCLFDFGLLDANQMKTVIDQLNEIQRSHQA